MATDFDEEEETFELDTDDGAADPAGQAQGGNILGKAYKFVVDFFAGRDVSARQATAQSEAETDDETEPEDDEFAYDDEEFEPPVVPQPFIQPVRPAKPFVRPAQTKSPDYYSQSRPVSTKGVRKVQDINSFVSPKFVMRDLSNADSAALQEIVDRMREGSVIVLNWEACSENDRGKVLDFLSGASCFQQGGFKKNGNSGWIVLPPNVEIDAIGANTSFFPPQ
ncbi:MAG: cell division protein SepF [Oscillospiraceae bacterium]|jgi:FtsZ-interacting cell division protein YlmF|nr:cell division protein SepF [Oscillospiraceae bacterium]